MSDESSKIASQTPQLMQMAAQHMRKMAADNVDLLKENEALQHENRVMKIARRLEQRGLETSLSFEEKVAKLQDLPVEKLASFEAAVELAAGGVSLGRVAPQDGDEKRASMGETYRTNSSGSDELEDFVMSQGAYGGS